MSDNHESGPVEASDVFYPEDNAEPLKPTAELEDENTDEVTSEDESIEDSEEEAELADDAENDDTKTDAEESEADEDEEDDTEGETLYLELDGEEFNLDEVRAWKSGHMMQADYTKKTQGHALDVTAFNDRVSEFEATKTKVSDLGLELEALVAEDKETDWAALKEEDIYEYTERKERADKRKAKVAELKSVLPISGSVLSDAEIKIEQQKLVTLFPSWVKDGKPTPAYTTDVNAAVEYAKSIGYSQKELNTLEGAHVWIGLIAASEASAKKSGKRSALEKKVRKAPLTTRPKKATVKKARSNEDVFYGSL